MGWMEDLLFFGLVDRWDGIWIEGGRGAPVFFTTTSFGKGLSNEWSISNGMMCFSAFNHLEDAVWSSLTTICSSLLWTIWSNCNKRSCSTCRCSFRDSLIGEGIFIEHWSKGWWDLFYNQYERVQIDIFLYKRTIGLLDCLSNTIILILHLFIHSNSWAHLR